MDQLLHDLAGGEVGNETHGACGAEGAPHLAAYLGRNAQSGAPTTSGAISGAALVTLPSCIVCHDDRFHLQAILQLDQQLHRLAVCGSLAADQLGGEEGEVGIKGCDGGFGQIRHVCPRRSWVVNQMTARDTGLSCGAEADGVEKIYTKNMMLSSHTCTRIDTY